MTYILRRVLTHRARRLTLIAGVLAVAAATTLALATTSSRQPEPRAPHKPEHGAARHPSSGPPGQLATTDAPTPMPTAPHGPARGTTAAGKPGAPVAAQTTTFAEGKKTSTAVPAGTAQPEDLLKRQDPVPDGVPAQVEFFGGGGGGCIEDPPGPPHIAGAAPVVEIPTEIKLCFFGFDNSKPLAVAFTPPSGLAFTEVLPPPEIDLYFTVILRWVPGDLIGPYAVTAKQDRLSASLGFSLRHASSPRLWLVGPLETVAPGFDFDLYLFGFPPDHPTLLHLYDTQTGRYRTSFTVLVGSNGRAHVVIDTQPNDPAGCYGIISTLAYNPGERSDSTFCILRGW